jgi:hypothetical protein
MGSMEVFLFKSYQPQGLRLCKGVLKQTKDLAVPLTGDPKLNGFFTKPLYFSSKSVCKTFVLTRGQKNKLLTSSTELTIQAQFLGEKNYEYQLTARREQSQVDKTLKTEGAWNFLGVVAEAAKRPSMIEQLIIHKPAYPFTLVTSDSKYKLQGANFTYFISYSLGMLHLDDEERVKKVLSRFCQPAVDSQARAQACKDLSRRIDTEVQAMLYFTRYKLNNPSQVTDEEMSVINSRWQFFRTFVLDSLIAICETSNLSGKEQKSLALLKKNLAAISEGVRSKEQIVNSYQQGDIIAIFAAFERELPGWNPGLPWNYGAADLTPANEVTGNTMLGFFWNLDKIYTNIHTSVLNNILVNRNSQLISYSIVGEKSDRLSQMHSNVTCVFSHKGVDLKVESAAVYWRPSSFSDAQFKKVEGDFKTDYCLVKQDGLVLSNGNEKKAMLLKIAKFGSQPRVFACSFGAALISHIPSQPGELFLYSEGGSQIALAEFQFNKTTDSNQIQTSAKNLLTATDFKQFLTKTAQTADEKTMMTGYTLSISGGVLMTPVGDSCFLMDFQTTETSSKPYQKTILIDGTSHADWKVLDFRLDCKDPNSSRIYFLATHITHQKSVYSLVFKKFASTKAISYTFLKVRNNKLHPIVASKKIERPKLLSHLNIIGAGTNDIYWDQKSERLIISERVRDQEGQKSPILKMPVKVFGIGF